MKKALLLIVLLALAGFTAYKLLTGKQPQHLEQKEEALSVSGNSGAFDSAFGGLLAKYYALKDAFVEWDTVKVNQLARTFQMNVDSLPLSEFKADSTLVETAGNYLSSISAELKGLAGEPTIEGKRKSFNMLTSEMYDLIRTVRYGGAVVYHERCPMAFGDSAEAFWLSNKAKIVNPYLGRYHPNYKDKMLGCGEVVDSLDFAKK